MKWNECFLTTWHFAIADGNCPVRDKISVENVTHGETKSRQGRNIGRFAKTNIPYLTALTDYRLTDFLPISNPYGISRSVIMQLNVLNYIKFHAHSGIIPHLAQTGTICPVRDKISVEKATRGETKSRQGRNICRFTKTNVPYRYILTWKQIA